MSEFTVLARSLNLPPQAKTIVAHMLKTGSISAREALPSAA